MSTPVPSPALNQARLAYVQGRFGEAADLARKRLGINRSDVTARLLLGMCHYRLEQLPEALAMFEHCARLSPGWPEPFLRIGQTRLRLGDHEGAVSAFDQTLCLDPAYPSAEGSRATALVALGKFDSGLEALNRAIARSPPDASLLNAMGVALSGLERDEEALEAFEAALRLEHGLDKALINRASCLTRLLRSEAALAAFDDIPSAARTASAYYNHALTLQRMDRFDDALATYGQALGIDPEYHNARWNRACLNLILGRWEDGWAEYDCRFQATAAEPLASHLPVLAQDPASWPDSVLVWSEQGLGDTLQFARFATVLAHKGPKVTLMVQPVLVRLLSGLENVSVIGRDAPVPDCQAQIALMSLPGLLRITSPEQTTCPPYIRPEPDLVQSWARELGPTDRLKVGLYWQGNPNSPADKGRSIPLDAFRPLSQLEGVQLIALQQGFGLDQLDALDPPFAIQQLARDFDSGPDAFIQTAAILANLDLLITSDTAIAHLAGAMGVKVWVVLMHRPDWRWQLEGEDCPWYPSARLLRQTRPGDWGEVFQAISSSLARFSALGSGSDPASESIGLPQRHPT